MNKYERLVNIKLSKEQVLDLLYVLRTPNVSSIRLALHAVINHQVCSFMIEDTLPSNVISINTIDKINRSK